MIEGVGLFLAGLIGGMVNAIAGGGSFITFPALMAAGVSPIAANATNTFASSAGYLSGAAGFRRELWAHRHQLPRVAVSALIGGGLGAWLLLQTPENTFSRAIPWLLLLATVLLVWGDPLQAALRRRFEGKQSLSALGGVLLALLLLMVCTYGGFFNAGLRHHPAGLLHAGRVSGYPFDERAEAAGLGARIHFSHRDVRRR